MMSPLTPNSYLSDSVMKTNQNSSSSNSSSRYSSQLALNLVNGQNNENQNNSRTFEQLQNSNSSQIKVIAHKIYFTKNDLLR